MRRAVVPLVAALALLTGVTLAETRQAVMAPGGAVPTGGQTAASARVVRAFYAAVNLALATGDDADLARVVAADLIEHPTRIGVDGRAMTLGDALRSARSAAPGFQVTVVDLVAQGDRVAARVDGRGAGDAAYLGYALDGGRLWGTVDLFRVERGRIVEYWRDAAGDVAVMPPRSFTLAIAEMMSANLALNRAIYVADARETLATDRGAALILVESGELTVVVDAEGDGRARLVRREESGKGAPATGLALQVAAATPVRAGDALLLAAWTTVRIVNDKGEAAVALMLTASEPPPSRGVVKAGREELFLAPAAAQTRLVTGPPVPLPAGELTVQIGRALIAPGVSIRPPAVVVAALTAIEGGEATIATAGESVWVSRPNGAWRIAEDGRAISAGWGLLVGAEGALGLRVAGDAPLALVMVAIEA